MAQDAPRTTKKAQLILTPRDEEILRAVYEYRFVTAQDITWLLFSKGSLTYVRGLLSALAGGEDQQERQYLFRFQRPTAKTGNREKIFTLGAAGRAFVSKVLGLPVNWYFRPYKSERLSHSQIAHNLLVTRLVVAAHRWTRTHPDYNLLQSRLCYELAEKISLQNQEQSAVLPIPDAWVHIEQIADGRRFAVLLECDCGTESQPKFKEHVRSRIEFIRSGEYAKVFETPSVIIAYATTGQHPEYREARRTAMTTWTHEVLQELHRENWARIFRFAAVEYEHLYDHTQAIFTEPVWSQPNSSQKVPLLT